MLSVLLELFFKSKLEWHLRYGAHKLFCRFRKSSSFVVSDNLLSESEKVHFTKYTIDYILIVTRIILLKQNWMMSWALLVLEEAVIVMTTVLMKYIIIIIIVITTTTSTTTTSYFISSHFSALLDW